MNAADLDYLERITEDCERMLGPGIVVRAIDRVDEPDTVHLVLEYELAGRPWTTEASGETVVAAHAELRLQLVADRLRLGFSVLVEPGAPAASSG